MGGMFSVVLSPDHSEPSLTATLSYGVRTFLLRSRGGDRLIHFSPAMILLMRLVNTSIGQPVGNFVQFATHMNDTIGIELTQQTGRALSKSTLSFSSLTRYSPLSWRTSSCESLCTTIVSCAELDQAPQAP